MSDVEFFAAWAETLDLLAARLGEMTFTPDSLSVEESDLARLGAQAGRALLEVVVRAGGGLAQPTMTGMLEPTSASINITMKPDDPKLYQEWVDRVPSPLLPVVCCWGSNFRGLTPQGRESDRLRQFWSWGGMVILAAQFPERFASVNPGARDFPRCEPIGRGDDGQLIFTHETEQITPAELAAWRRSQARDWAEACRAVAGAVRKFADAKGIEREPAMEAPSANVHTDPPAPASRPDTAPPIEPVPDPLQAIRADLERRESDVATQADQTVRREQLDKRFGERFTELTSFVASALARDERSQGDTFFAAHALALLAFNEVLREYHQEFPRFRILERLGQASRAGVPALDTAASLLLQGPAAGVEQLAGDLARFQASRPQDVWGMWLTYILDQLLNSHRPPLEKHTVPPDTTREEWRKAELAFGCVFFTDDSFAVMQEAVDHAAGMIEDALKRGGYPALRRPPGRVRDLIARFDPRALHWFGSTPQHPGLLQPPPSIEAITEPVTLRRRLDEVWTAANLLQIALEKWTAWFVELREKGDAHPGIALNCCEMAHRAITVLLTHRPNAAPFDRADEADLSAMLPPTPAWWMPGTEVDFGPEGSQTETARTRWQEDREFLDGYYSPLEGRSQRAVELQGAARRLIDLLKSFPMTAVATSSSPSARRRQPIGIAEGSLQVPTVGIITALPHETAAVLAILGEPPRIDVPGSGAGRAYWMAELPSPLGGVHRVVVAQADMGNNIAAVRATQLLSHFPNVASIVMCGIAGGIPHREKVAEHVRLGDIVVSNQKGVVQYDFVKRTVRKKRTDVCEEIRAAPHRPSAVLLEAGRILEANTHLGNHPWEEWIREGLKRLAWARPDDSTDVLTDPADTAKSLPHPTDLERRNGQPRVFFATIASANTLLKDPKKRDALREQFGVKAVEMEGSGIQDATWSHGVGYLVVRGVCDYCDANKNDFWQRYAAVVAAAYVRALLEAMPGTEAT